MSTVLVVDSACDLPSSFLKENLVKVLPLNLTINGRSRLDKLTTDQKLKLYRAGTENVETGPSLPEQVYQFFMDEVVAQSSFAIAQTISKARSPNYQNWIQAQGKIQKHYREVKSTNGRSGHFSLRIMNSSTLFAGQGVLAAHTVKLINDGVSKNELRQIIEDFKPKVYVFAVPKDVRYLRVRAKKKGEKSVGRLASVIGKALNIAPIIQGNHDDSKVVAKSRGYEKSVNRVFAMAIEKLKEGVATPYLTVSIADDLSVLSRFEMFEPLVKQARLSKVELLRSVMSVAGGVNLGPGTVSLALATEKPEFYF